MVIHFSVFVNVAARPATVVAPGCRRVVAIGPFPG